MDIKKELEIIKEKYKVQKTIFDNAYDGMYIMDKDGYTEDINDAYLQITGLKKENLVGFHMQELIEKGYFNESAGLKVCKTKKTVTIIDTFQNGKRCLVTANPVFDDDERFIRVVSTVRDMTELMLLQQGIEETQKLNEQYEEEINYLRQQNMSRNRIIGKNSEFIKLLELVHKGAGSDATVLITGETGTGKEVIAKEVHNSSYRKSGPFIKVNCAAIPENLLESELFGYEKGAFTGAQKSKLGKFELAQKGTILLDEIGEMPTQLQSKILRVIQEREIYHLGGTKPINIDIRIIASTNCNLIELIKKGKFREDLYYRLNVIPVSIPPLRDRRDDIVLFVDYFIKKYNKKYNRYCKLSRKALRLLEKYDWPGNIRELENLIERLIVTSDITIISAEYLIEFDEEKFCYDINYSCGKGKLNEIVQNVERQVIKKASLKYKNTREMAKALGVSQPTVVRKMKKYGISPKNI
ncbi:sigma-54 interaction domain-containing protein [Maledivibacter halophilus]|uniref:HTH-type transcriptional regulatory protein TyrR n=1 Tax=Maledivibacter halophilus TaxID=36842 RepID=A0A1T5LY16_9FIRM|nr:sigma 54-interacting transcriptional regulator [Maledivibacter halophilus]SKC80861.1 PAS domain S-box-containing protein/TyrR family helix-turn-helix domain-containing protein [Maledivibacter halophilus]